MSLSELCAVESETSNIQDIEIAKTVFSVDQNYLPAFIANAGKAHAYLPDVAKTCNHLAGLLSNINRYNEAEKFYREALDIHRSLQMKRLLPTCEMWQ